MLWRSAARVATGCLEASMLTFMLKCPLLHLFLPKYRGFGDE
jgi:hypothetical protein